MQKLYNMYLSGNDYSFIFIALRLNEYPIHYNTEYILIWRFHDYIVFYLQFSL